MGVLTGLQPTKVFEYFELLSSVPHGSGNTKAISDICVNFAKEHGYKFVQDEVNNVIIYCPATPGREDEPSVIMQGHLDMVCAKDPSDPIDMSVTPITLVVDGDFVKANGTSLGGDNAIAVAMVMAVLDDKSLSHPAIEAVFTVDEEVGMDGAVAIDGSLLSSRRMLNIDSEAEGVFTCGCAGGARVNCKMPLVVTAINPKKYIRHEICVSGLLGGHSGAEIHKGRPNSNVLMARMLYEATNQIGIKLLYFEGGKFDNAITNETKAVVYTLTTDSEAFIQIVHEFDKIYKNEYSSVDPDIYVSINSTVDTNTKLRLADVETTKKAFFALAMIPFGVQEMSPDIKGLVQTSLNPGIVSTSIRDIDGSFKFSYSVRSSVESQKQMLITKIKAITMMAGGSSSVHGEYPGWKYAKESPVREQCVATYKKLYNKEPIVMAIHAGLECGLLMEKLPGLDCISFGPDLYDIHSVRERLSISSTARLWDFIVELLKCKY